MLTIGQAASTMPLSLSDFLCFERVVSAWVLLSDLLKDWKQMVLQGLALALLPLYVVARFD
jgi:hypothetical protein